MNKPLKLIPIGNSTGVILPKEVLARLQVSKGDQLSVSFTKDGVVLQAYDAEFERQMAVAREVMKKDRKALAALAKL